MVWMAEDQREYARKYYEHNKPLILERNRRWAAEHPEKMREYFRKYARQHQPERTEYMVSYRARNPERIREINKRSRDRHKDVWRAANKRYWQKVKATPELLEKERKRKAADQKRYLRRARLKCLHYYGGNHPKCACCNEDTIEFLTIDHINNDGAKFKKENPSWANRIPQWLVKNDFPTGIQVLCYNCNNAKRSYGICPHQRGNPEKARAMGMYEKGSD